MHRFTLTSDQDEQSIRCIVICALFDKALSYVRDALCEYNFDELDKLGNDNLEERYKAMNDLLRPYNFVSAFDL